MGEGPTGAERWFRALVARSIESMTAADPELAPITFDPGASTLHIATGAIVELVPIRHELDRAPEGERAERLERFLRAAVAASRELADVDLGDPGTALQRLGLRLQHAHHDALGTAIGRDVVLAAGLELEHGVVAVTSAHARRWGWRQDHVLAVARARTARAAFRCHRASLVGASTVDLVLCRGGPFTTGLVACPEAAGIGVGETAATLAIPIDERSLLFATVTPVGSGEHLGRLALRLLGIGALTGESPRRFPAGVVIRCHRGGRLAIFEPRAMADDRQFDQRGGSDGPDGPLRR